MIEFLKHTNLDFMKLRKAAYVLSGLLLAYGFYSFYLLGSGKANLGLDFTGGSTVHVKFSKEIKSVQLRDIMDKGNYSKASIQQVGDAGSYEFLIRLGAKDVATGDAVKLVSEALMKGSGDEGLMVLGSSEIGPIVSAQLKEKAVLAVFWAVVGILVYIWIRFKFKFAVAATAATFHDVIVVLGIMVLSGKEIDLLTITALLTIGGYSLTDTVVVFDRIRENMKFILKEPLDAIVNRSINEVLSRTIITSGTVMLVALSLFLFGGHVLHNFSFALVIGVVIGTYSSIFVASPIVVDWEAFEKKNRTVK